MTEVQGTVRFRPSPFLRNVILSGASAGARVLSLVLVTGWLAAGFGPAAFGVYALSRRLLSAAASLSPGPLGVGLARALAMAASEREREAHFCAGVLLTAPPNLLLLVAGLAFPSFWAELFLSDSRYAPELLATLALILATAAYTLMFSRFWGMSQFSRANLWQLWVLTFGPLVVAFAFARRGSVALVVVLMAAVVFTSVVPLLGWVAGAVRSRIRWPEIRESLRGLVHYTLPRMPAAAAFGGMLAVGPLLAPYFGDLRQAGYLVAGQSVLRMVEAGTAGFGLVVLPKVSILEASGRRGFLRERIEDLVGITLHMGLFAACQLAVWTPELVSAWLGPEYAEATVVIRALLCGLVPYLAYTLLRSVIDGMEERAVNTWNLIVAFICSLTLSIACGLAGLGALGLAAAGSVGFAVLGALTVLFLKRRLDLEGGYLGVWSALVLNLVAALLIVGLKSVVVAKLPARIALVAGLGLSGALLVGYLVALRFLKVRWLLQVETRLVHRGTSQ